MKRISYVLVFILVLCLCTCVAFADGDHNQESNLGYSTDQMGETSDEVTVLRISANQTSGLHRIILTLIGDYNPIVTDHTYQNYNGYTQHAIDVTPDWSWISTCFLFVVVIFCTFRFIGGLFSRG